MNLTGATEQLTQNRSTGLPSSVSETDLERYLADLCHEWATEAGEVYRARDTTLDRDVAIRRKEIT